MEDLEHPIITHTMLTGYPPAMPGWVHMCCQCDGHIYPEEKYCELQGGIYCSSCVEGNMHYA